MPPRHAAPFFFALACLASAAVAQDLAFVDGPKIVSVTPKDGGASIAFLPPTESATTPEVLEYNVECRVPGDNMIGTSMYTLEGSERVAELYGLENGKEYVCDVAARGATGGLLPRAIDSPVSNLTPAFTPMAAVQATKFVEEPSNDAAVVPPTDVGGAAVLPRAPSIKDIEMVSPGEAKISFSLPAGQESSPITGFIAACQHNNDANASSQSVAPAGATSVMVTGLTKPGEWTCSVVGQTADGIGESATKIIEVDATGTVEAQDGEANKVPDAAVSVFSSSVAAVLVALFVALF